MPVCFCWPQCIRSEGITDKNNKAVDRSYRDLADVRFCVRVCVCVRKRERDTAVSLESTQVSASAQCVGSYWVSPHNCACTCGSLCLGECVSNETRVLSSLARSSVQLPLTVLVVFAWFALPKSFPASFGLSVACVNPTNSQTKVCDPGC